MWEYQLLTSVETVCGEKFKEIPSEISRAIILEPSVQILNKDKKTDDLILAGLKSKLGEEIGGEIFNGPLQAITKHAQKETRHDMVESVKLKSLEGEIGEKFDRFIINYQSKTKLSKKDLRFALTTDINLYSRYLGEYEDIFFSVSIKKYGMEITSDIYDVKEVMIDELVLERKETKKEDFYEIRYSHDKLQDKIGMEVLISYIIETVLSKEGNYFFVNIVCPTKTVTVTFSSDRDLSYIDPCAFFVSLKEPAIRGYESNGKNKSKDIFAQVSLNDWVFPHSGVIFVWSRKKTDLSGQ